MANITTTRPLVLQEVPISRIVEGNLFRRLNRKKVDELKESIKAQGLLQPIRVRTIPGGKYQVTFGHHRLQACKDLGWETIPGYVIDEDEIDASNKQIVENLQRNEEKNYTLLGDWFKVLLGAEHWDLARIAHELGKTTTFVEYCIKLSDDIDPQLHADFSDTIPRACAYDFSRIPREKQVMVMERIKKRLAKEHLSTQQIRQQIFRHLQVRKYVQVQTCRTCGGIITKEDIEAGMAELTTKGTDFVYDHKERGDCQFNEVMYVSFTGKQSRQELVDILRYAKEKLEEKGAKVSLQFKKRTSR